ncbi:hypothetical protein [Chryseobacterium lathyri]|uniref:Uncharacterized protein n=1 Tax=Chryseobacterium lathyri TaxID=395933 RepID=A0ABT9SJY7_9FLAO|nr:hypothetical protein [Chryseobacterium lathyri]MDP9959747.1 hypothetical protein [Chryseobacterium lathyri]MDQ0064681.1 hypothetical protein [Chryseobacterium lathyri]
MDNYLFSERPKPDSVVFGERLANLVADKLQTGAVLGYSHRDYCGMGMKVNEDQKFMYGEIYDGDFNFPRIFETRDLFVTWLSAQSTASLARLDEEGFYKENQVITRKRLLDFIR